MRLTVGIICYEQYPETGTSARTLGFVRALVGRNHKVIMLGPAGLTTRETERVHALGADFVDVSSHRMSPGVARSMLNASCLMNTVKKVHRKFGLDVIHLEHVTMNSLTLPTLGKLKIPTISDIQALASARDVEPGLPRRWTSWASMSKYEYLEAKFSNGILVPTTELKQELLKRYDSIRKIYVVENCVSNNGTHVVDRKLLGEAPNVFFHANFNLVRSRLELTRLLRVQEKVKNNGGRLRIFLAGPGTEKLPNHDDLVNLGYVERPIDYLHSCDLVILPIKDQTLGLHSRIVEAMMAGKPIVATSEACCGLMDYIRDSGIIVSNSVDEMAELSRSVIRDQDRLKVLGERNRALALRLFSPSRIGEALEQAYFSIVER